MFLTIESARLPCWTTFSRLPFSMWVSSSSSARFLSSTATSLRASPSSSTNSWESVEKLLTKFSGFLISCGELPERGELLRLNKAILRGAQLLERFGKLLGSLLHLFEHADVTDGDHGLIGKGLEQSDLLVTEGVHLGAAEHDGSDALALTQ